MVTRSSLASFSLSLSQWLKKAGEIKNWDTARQPLRIPQVGKQGVKAMGGSICCVRGGVDKAVQDVRTGHVCAAMSSNFPSKK